MSLFVYRTEKTKRSFEPNSIVGILVIFCFGQYDALFVVVVFLVSLM